MNKVSIIFFLLLLTVLAGCESGQTEKTVEKKDSDTVVVEPPKPKIKMIHEVCYDSKYGRYNTLSYDETLYYYEDGRDSASVVIDANRNRTQTNDVYNEKKRLVRQDIFINNGSAYSLVYKYDKKGRIDNITDTSCPNPIEQYSYNKKGKKTWKYEFDGVSKLPRFANHYEYDDNGYLKSETQYDSNAEKVIEEHTYKYNKDGYLEKEDYVGRFDGDIHITYEYTGFDEEGNWLECRRSLKQDGDRNEYVSKTMRTYEYWSGCVPTQKEEKQRKK